MFRVYKYMKEYDLFCGVISSVEAKDHHISTRGLKLASISKLRSIVREGGASSAYGGDKFICLEGVYMFNYSTNRYEKMDRNTSK